MKTRIAPTLSLFALAGIAGAQVTGFRVSAGYGWTGGIKDNGGVRRNMSGPELTVTLPLNHLPLVEIGLEGDILFGGGFANSSIKGNIYRAFLTGRATIPGSQVGAFLGTGFGSAQGRAGDFASVNGFVTQLGVSFPLGMRTPVLAPSLEVAGYFSSRTALSGFSVSVAVKF